METQPNEAVRLLAQRILDMGYEDIPAHERKVIERVARRLAVSRNVNRDYDEEPEPLPYSPEMASHGQPAQNVGSG